MMEPEELLKGRSRETQIHRDASGKWFLDGAAIVHPKVVAAFNAWIDVADDGRFCLRNSIHWVYVSIDDAPVFVDRISVEPEGIDLHLSDGERERLDEGTLRQSQEGVLYCSVRQGRLSARFSRSAMQGLEDHLGEDQDGVFVMINEQRVRPPVVAVPVEEGRP